MVMVHQMALMAVWFFVPSMRQQIRRYAAGYLHAASRVVDGPAAYPQKARYSLPFDRKWYVFNGGVEWATSPSWDIAGQRYAYGFVIADGALRRWQGAGKRLNDYYCYGVPILAPAAGVIVEVRDDVRDASGVGTGWIDSFTPDFRDNFVVIRRAEGEYNFLAHLVAGSIRVVAGERAARGQQVGRCGNSGHSTEPHPHFHVQDPANVLEAAGLPVVFDNVSVDGETLTPERYLERSMCVRKA